VTTSGFAYDGVSVPISASPDSGYYFTGWTGYGSVSYTGSAISAWVTLFSDISETGSFALGTASVTVRIDDTPLRFNLEQNYPNPFNPSTTIKYALPRASQVNLSVYDILGREVSVLVNDRRDAGVYEVKFDGSNLASGVYFYRLQAGTYVETKKLLLVR
jgi:hypothetical protein